MRRYFISITGIVFSLLVPHLLVHAEDLNANLLLEPYSISGTLSPYIIAIDGVSVFSPENSSFPNLYLDRAPVSVRSEPNQPFYVESTQDRLILGWKDTNGKFNIHREIFFPRIHTVKQKQQGVQNLGYLEFTMENAQEMRVNNSPLSIDSRGETHEGKRTARWPLPASLNDLLPVYAVEVRSKQGLTRIYTLVITEVPISEKAQELNETLTLGPYRITVERDQPSKFIRGVRWISKYGRIKTDVHLILRGRFERKAWQLFSGRQKLQLTERGFFAVAPKIEIGSNSIQLRSVAPDGSEEQEKINIRVTKISSPVEPEPEAKLATWIPSLGLTQLNYTETGRPSYRSLVMTGKLSYNHVFGISSRWDLGLNIFGTLTSLSSNMEQTTVHYLGGNARIGYSLGAPKAPWSLKLMFGYYYITMFVSENIFGFNDLQGPQIYPVIRRTFQNGHEFSGYFKYSPVAKGISLLSRKSHEVATGLSYIFGSKEKAQGNMKVGLMFDYSNLMLDLDGVEGQSHSYSLSIGLVL